MQWQKMIADHPEILEGSTNKYQNWEVTDPERWVPHGYVVIRVDSRGAGWSPGFMDPNSPREIEDLYQCIEWAGTQPWSNGKVGHARDLLLCQQPVARRGHAPAAPGRHHPLGGAERPLPRLRLPRRHPEPVPGALGQAPGGQRAVRAGGARPGRTRTPANRWPGPSPSPTRSWPRTGSTRTRSSRSIPSTTSGTASVRPTCPRSRSPSCPAPTGAARESTRGATSTASSRRPPSRSGSRPTAIPTGRCSPAPTASPAEALLRPFPEGHRQRLGEDPAGACSTSATPARSSSSGTRTNGPWPGPGGRNSTSTRPAWPSAPIRSRRKGRSTYEALGNGVTFSLPPLEKETEITGPLAAKLFVSSSTQDADLFLILRVFDPGGQGADLHGVDRPEHADRQRLAAGLAPAARPEKTKPYRPTTPTTASSR